MTIVCWCVCASLEIIETSVSKCASNQPDLDISFAHHMTEVDCTLYAQDAAYQNVLG